MAEKREWERRKEEQRKDIVTMVSHVDRIAASFDRYQNTSTIITFSEPRPDAVVPDHLFTWVEKDLIALWMFTVEPTKEERVDEASERYFDQFRSINRGYVPASYSSVDYGKLNV